MSGAARLREPADRRRRARPGPQGRVGNLARLALAGLSIRITLLAVPPLLPAIHHTLRLDETAVGLLTGVPIAIFAVGSALGSLAVARLGARRAVVVGLLIVAAAGALRGAGNSVPVLLAMTATMALGIATAFPALPTLVQRWCPESTGQATAVYTGGMLGGEVLAAGLSAPLLLGLVGGSWAAALFAWSIPVAVSAWFVGKGGAAEAPAPAGAGRWWPDWRSPWAWRFGLILGGASIVYLGGNAFISEYLRASGRAGLIAPALGVLNLMQIPGALMIARWPEVLVGRRSTMLVAGGGVLVSLVGLLTAAGVGILIWSGLLGLAASIVFILCLAMPPRMAAPADVHRLAAAMASISYTVSFCGVLLSGALWDATRHPLAAFVPLLAAGLGMVVLAARLPRAQM